MEGDRNEIAGSGIPEQMYNTADLLLSSTYNHFAQVFGNNDIVFNAMYADSFSPIETYKINEYLNDLIIANPLVHSVYVYNMKKKFIFSSLSMVSDFKRFFDTDMTEMLENGNYSEQGVFIPRQERFTYLNKKYDSKLITVIYSEYGSSKTIEGSFVLNLDQQVLHNLVTKGNASSTQQSFILSGSGTVISGSDNNSAGRKVLDQQMIQKVLQSKENSGRLFQSMEGKEYLISYMKSDRLGWSFVGVAEYGSLLQKVNANKRFIVWVSVFFVLAAAVTAFFSTRMIYSPLRRLVKRIGTSSLAEKEAAPLNEYDLLARSFLSYEDLIRHLQTKVSDFAPSKKNELLRSIVSDGAVPAASHIQDLGTQLTGSYYRVCLLRIDAYQKQMKRYDTSDIALLKYAMTNIAQEIVSPHYKMETWSDNSDSVVLIFNINDDDCSHAAIETLLSKIQTHITGYLSMSVTVSIGPAAAEIGRIRHSWQQAHRLSQYRLVLGNGGIIAQDMEANRDSSDVEAILSLEKTIMDNLKTGDKEKLRHSVADFMLRVSDFQYDDLIEQLSGLMLMTVRVAKGMIEEEELLQTGVYSLPQAVYQWETLDEIHAFYLEALERVLELREQDNIAYFDIQDTESLTSDIFKQPNFQTLQRMIEDRLMLILDRSGSQCRAFMKKNGEAIFRTQAARAGRPYLWHYLQGNHLFLNIQDKPAFKNMVLPALVDLGFSLVASHLG